MKLLKVYQLRRMPQVLAFIKCCAVLLSVVGSAAAADRADIVVAKDGSGQFTTIQSAINSVASSNNKNVTILVKNGTYTEHLVIDKSCISLVGESREKTIIQFSINRTEWTSSSGSSVGCAVINIGCTPSFKKTSSTVTDIVIGNLTVENTFNTTGDKTMVIKDEGNSNRIFVVGCNVWCKGHDTISLWSSQTGMYYHADCSFRGSIDVVCPRGWCYTVGCNFYEGTSSSPLWHEVAAGSTQKFVIRTGSFSVVDGNTSSFRLLNSNNSSSLGTRFFLLDCMISSKATTKGNFTEAYFYNCHGEKSDQTWYANNLASAPGSPIQREITAKWTFDNKWDPENTMPSALPHAALPQPWDGAYGLAAGVQLKWIGGRNAERNAVYFGTTNPPPLVTTQVENSYSPANLANGTYYWRIDAIGGADTVRGSVWAFKVDQGVAVSGVGGDAPSRTAFTADQRAGWLTVTYTSDRGAWAKVGLYDVLGKERGVLAMANENTGKHTRKLSLGKYCLPKGWYLARLKTGSIIQTAGFIVR